MTKEPVSNKDATVDGLPDAERTKHIRGWLDDKLQRWAGRGLIGGLGSMLMALPALAQATSAQLDTFQFVDAIPGVRSAKLLANGDVQLKMMDGRTLVVDAEDVQILDNGAIMVADEAASQIAQFGAAAEAGAAATASSISSTGLVLSGLGVAGAAAAAGGGGGGGDIGDDRSEPTQPGGGDREPATTPPAPSLPILNLAELQANALNNISTDVSAPDGTSAIEVTIGSLTKSVAPDLDGSWRISLTAAEAAALPQGAADITVRALDADGIELSTGTARFDVDTIPPTVTISAISCGDVLNTAEKGTDLVISGTTDAGNGQTVTVTVNGQTYTSAASGGNWTATIPSADLVSLPNGATITVTADVSDRAGNPSVQASDSFDTDFTAPTLTLDPVAGGSIDLVDVQGDLTLTGTTTAEDGQAVTVTFQGRDYTGTASGGNWSVTIPNADLADLTTGSPVAVSATTSDQASNPATSATASVPVDLTGPSISITPLTVGAVLNAAEVASDLTVSGLTGNVPDGQQVTVTVNGQTYSGTVSSGAWTVTIPSADLGALADGGSFTLTADVANSDGLNAPQADIVLSKDVTAPGLSIDGFSHGTVLNAAERGTDLTITGTTNAEDNQTVTVNLNGETYLGSVSGGAWSITVPAARLSNLPDGATINITANVSDAAGNPAAQASGSFDTDFTAPTLTISPLPDGSVMNLSERATDLIVNGSSDAPDGTVITVELARPDNTVDVSGTATVNGGAWTFTAPAASLGDLQDDETYSVNAAVTDAAGNRSTVSTSIETDFTAPTITLSPLSVGAQLDVEERGADLTVSGTTSAEDGQSVTVNLGGRDYAALVSGGSWSVAVPTADLTALPDASNITVTASVQDANGNAASDATASFTTDFRPILRLNPIGSNDAVPLADAQNNGLTVSGTAVGLTAGQVINVTLNGNSAGTATVAANGTWSANISGTAFSGLTAGDAMNISATATVVGRPDPTPVTDQVIAYTPAPYIISEVGQSGSTVTFAIYADPDRDVSSGLAFDADLGFDSSVITFNAGSDVKHADLTIFSVNHSGNPVRFGGAAISISDLSQPLVTFEMTVQDASKPIELQLTSPQGGPTRIVFGTDGTDMMAGTQTDDVIRGGGGDDTIDLSGAGRDILVLEADPNDNGIDTITGFNLGPAAIVSDAIIFSGLDPNTLRGNGTVVETLGTGDSLGANTGFVGFSTRLTNLNEDTIATAAETLTDAQSGDEIYALVTDGTDSALVKVNYTGADTATVEKMAEFDGLSDLSAFHADNILLTDPTGASA